MRYSDPPESPTLDSHSERLCQQERSEVLQQWEDWLETPMLVLGFAWLGLFIVELVWGLNPLLAAIGTLIWIVFIIDFGIKLLLAPCRVFYLQHHWLTAFSLFVPALRTLRILQVIRPLRSIHAVRGLQLLQVMTRTNKGMRVLAASMGRRGFGYVVGATAIVTLLGSAGMYAFEHELSVGAAGIPDYGTALWWTAMVMTTVGSDYFPKTAEGRVLCFLLALYAVAICGYVTATLATFFVGQDAGSDDAELAGAKSIQALQAEITALRTEIQALAQRDVDP
ncbi:MAG: potassium channel family protein [Drouetiella hepatica Uher 2000/2452]|jgi:voltage-gated potassium channel|uniref:Potassium channel family protein n=1 Tax=Drouetiella hepatica Uher 2000/2452 TaxID=904376 RepID=A0A951QHM7_9CYAN|nr:potassium channel family protein [Drouetiella hepatica Uher 2000/2452]